MKDDDEDKDNTVTVLVFLVLWIVVFIPGILSVGRLIQGVIS